MTEPRLNYELLSSDNPVFSCYTTWGSILIIKLLIMAVYTGVTRFRTKAFENPEDAPEGTKTGEKNEKVERIRRCHLNDVESIPAFLLTSLWYILCNPNPLAAMMLIRIGAIARIVHTFVYAVCPVRQPARAICFFITYLINIFMCLFCIYCYHGI